MGCCGSSLLRKRNSKVGSFDLESNDLLYYNIINMANGYSENSVLQTIGQIKSFSTRFKVINYSDISVIIITIKPNGKNFYVTTIWESHEGLAYNICAKTYHSNIKNVDEYLNTTLDDLDKSNQMDTKYT